MSQPSCSDVCEVVIDWLLELGFKIDLEGEDHTDVLEALGQVHLEPNTPTKNQSQPQWQEDLDKAGWDLGESELGGQHVLTRKSQPPRGTRMNVAVSKVLAQCLGLYMLAYKCGQVEAIAKMYEDLAQLYKEATE